MNKRIGNVVIVGGGTAGWITASLMAKVLGKAVSITLVESDDIATIGVGEASIPPMQPFNQALGINEAEFMAHTKSTIKLGIQFEGWGKATDSYMHAFGGIGKNFPFCDFYHFWLRARAANKGGDFWDYSLNFQAAKAGKFNHLNQIPGTALPGLSYAYHFDAGLYARFLREKAQAWGVKRIEGKIEEVRQCKTSGFIRELVLQSKEVISGDLFVDCSGLHALLIDKTLNAGFEDWSHWLLCDSAMAVPCAHGNEKVLPYTRSIAHDSGWQWQIPLQHRIGNGLVYSSRYLDDEAAKSLLMENLPGKALAEPRKIKFRTGRIRAPWTKNVVAIGLSSGFLEPLESTSIHLIQTAAVRLIKHFPHQGIANEQQDAFNQQSKIEFERIRDFIILHYALNERTDSAFWRHCAQMNLPKTLTDKLALYKSTGKLFREDEELFTEIAWQQVLIGQGLVPDDFHPLANVLTDTQLDDLFDSLNTLTQQTVKGLASHNEFLEKFARG
ncbi:Tryptophan halogenase [Pseudoalteromonas luteoviolacea B = ATCC 29581]|nr:Tryptophan halogenase [Pseudoalteromonas luteoviolacea B = ATCC 29581]